MFHTYALENTAGKFYIGHTDDLERRLRQHNDSEDRSHLGKFTHKNGPWTLVWSQAFTTRAEAMKREKQIKAWKSSKRIRNELLLR